jgi:murein DD-endopeptidase MepM/ murein hydrolase activator NlpD
MTTGTVAGVRDFIRKVFPERQIYHRSNGTVHFTVLGPATQIALTCLLFVFLGWVAYASVNVVFKDQIIAAKDARFLSMQKAYESRISKQQLAYDELNGLLTLAEEKFSTSTDELETKFRQIEGMVAQNRKIEEKRAELDEKLETLAGREYLLPPLPRSLSEATTQPSEEATPTDDTDTGGPYIPAAAPQPDESAFVPASEELIRHAKKNYTAQQLVTIWNRQNNLRGIPIKLMEHMLRETQPTFAEQELMISASGLRVDEITRTSDLVEAGVEDESGQGGPLMSLVGTVAIASETPGDLNYDQLLTDLSTRLDQMSDRQTVLDVMPLALPIRTAKRQSSGFGPRLDPFTKRWAFHAGIDFSSEYGLPVLATSPGMVVQAERRGPYGNMVEIEHASGFRTRYGHLNAISVKVGDIVEFQQEVGKVGSTGRSTGPHLHYEIWYEGKVRDPRNFLKVGRYVFEKQG